MKPTLRALFALTLLGLGCAASIPSVEVEQPRALQSVNGSSYVAPLKHDLPPSERGANFAVTHTDDDEGFKVTPAEDLPAIAPKNAHGF